MVVPDPPAHFADVPSDNDGEEPLAHAGPPGPAPHPRGGYAGAIGPDRSYCFPNGSEIRAYPNIGKYEAICSNPAHGRCILTRTYRMPARRSHANPYQGRPLGKLSFFCMSAFHAQHVSHITHIECDPTLEERSEARADLTQDPMSEGIRSFERPQADGEGDEPPFIT